MLLKKRFELSAVVLFVALLISDWLWPTESMGGIALPPFFFGWFGFVIALMGLCVAVVLRFVRAKVALFFSREVLKS